MKQTYTIHNLLDMSMSEAYDFTQYSDIVKDGDVLLVQDGVAIMFKAWPTMANGHSEVFHNVEPTEGEVGVTWMKFTLESWPMVDYASRFLDTENKSVEALLPLSVKPVDEYSDNGQAEDRANRALSCDHYAGF